MLKTRAGCRAKGQRRERQAVALAEAAGECVFRLYQPAYTAQGPLDFISISADGRQIRLVQVRSNRPGDLRAIKALPVESLVAVTKEVWVWHDGEPQPRQRVLA